MYQPPMQPNKPGHGTSAEKPAGGASTQARRTKVTTACLTCRARKVKCDGRRPVCTRCAAKVGPDGHPVVPCEWDTADGRAAGVPTNPGAAKRAKRAHSDLVDTGDGNAFATPQFFLSPSSASSPIPCLGEGLRGLSTAGGNTSNSQHNGHHELWVDALDNRGNGAHHGETCDLTSYGEVGRGIEQELGRRGRRGALGTASVGPLASNIQNSAAGDTDPEERPAHPFQTVALNRHNSIIFRPSQRLNEIDLELPRRAKSDTLLGIYWEFFHPIFPTLDIIETKEAYAKLWTGDSTTPNRIFLSIINMIFALASRVDTSLAPAPREEASARYCGRALELFNRGRMHCVSFSSIQAALLIAEYLHSLHPEQCWMYSGIAIRMAQSLGLHRPRMTSSIRSPRALLLCRRVWKLCVAWDRILCMTYGRSMMVSQREASLFPPLHALSTESDTTPESLAEDMASLFLDKSLEMYMVVGRALDDFSSWDLEAPEQESLTPTSRAPPGCIAVDSVLRYERALSDLRATLPPSLLIPTVFETTAGLLQQRHAVVLHQRFSQAQTVLLRPLLSYLVRLRQQPKDGTKHHPPDSLHHRTVIQCAISCVAAARDTIQTLHTYHRYPAGRGSLNLTNTWWNNVLYLYSAATALIAARFCSEVVSGVGKAEMDKSWSLVLRLFREYEANGRWVRQLSQILQRLVRTAEVALSPAATTSARPVEGGDELDRPGDSNLAADEGPDGMESLFATGIENHPFLPLPDPLAVIEGGMPFFHQGTDLDAVYYFGNDPFSALGDGMFGG